MLNKVEAAAFILSPGVCYAFKFKNESQLVIGVAAPIGLSAAAPDYGVFLYFHSNISSSAEAWNQVAQTSRRGY